MTDDPLALPRWTAAVLGRPGARSSANAVVLCCDARFAFFSRVTLSSILANTSRRDFDVFVITDGLDDPTLDGLDRLGKLQEVAISVLTVPRDFVEALPTRMHWTGASYLRLLAPDLTQASLIVYLDSDIIVQADIAELFAFARHPTACVSGVIDEKGGRFRKRPLGLGPEEPYLNSGVLLIDAAQWRSTDVFRQTVALIKSKGFALVAGEQDALNVVLVGRKGLLPAQWNLQTYSMGSYGLRRLGNIDGFSGVLHFSGTVKPWMRWADPWGRALYLKYAEPLGLPPDFWKEPETVGHKLLEAMAADEAEDAARANAVRKEVIRLLLRLCKGQASDHRLDEI